jgi:hypothetical protein
MEILDQAARWQREFPSLFPLEFALAILTLPAAWLLRKRRAFGEIAVGRLTRRPLLACGAVVLFVLASRVLLLAVLPIPEPMIRDEFSHLFNAKTFALGRVANPTHPEWVHFEAPYIIHQPTYSSIYLPGQGLTLAFGQLIMGHPWWGVWLTTGLLCGAICWMLQGWLPPSWALYGAVIAALRLGLFSYWMNSYWGGSVVALGGALALGALPRLKQRRTSISVVFASGLVIMAFTRPYEGLFLAVGIGAAGAWWVWRKPLDTRALTFQHVLARGTLVPVVLVLLAGGVVLSYFGWKTTGSPVDLPFNVYVREYWAARHFIPLALPPKVTYRHDVFQSMATWFREEHEKSRSLTGYLRRNASRALGWWSFYCGPILSIPLLLGYRVLVDRRVRPLLIIVGVFAMGLSLEVPRMPHYAGPITAAWLALWVQSARHTAVNPFGRWVMRLIPVALGLVLLVRLTSLMEPLPTTRRSVYAMEVVNWCCVPRDGIVRADVERELRRAGGKHLVFFQLPQGRFRSFDWVYNEPEIDAAEIVWARAMSSSQDAALAAQYPDRRVWFVDATPSVPTLNLYSPSMSTRTLDGRRDAASTK